MPLAGKTYDQQWRPVTLYETGDTDALSVRGYRDFGRNANNLKVYATPWQIAQCWKGFFEKATTSTDEVFLFQVGPLPVPSPFTQIRWEVGGQAPLGVTYTIRVYSQAYFYTGTFLSEAETSSCTLDTSHSYKSGVVNISGAFGLLPEDNVQPYTFLIVTGQSNAIVEDVAELSGFFAWPEPREP